MANPISKLINPWYPSTALGFEKGIATMVQLERGRGGNVARLVRTKRHYDPDNVFRSAIPLPTDRDTGRISARDVAIGR